MLQRETYETVVIGCYIAFFAGGVKCANAVSPHLPLVTGATETI